VAADFLELLMFGTLSMQLQTFLLVDLTDKGLKRWAIPSESMNYVLQKCYGVFLGP
jgi:hypothetical protein